jgi:tartrate-resistant acid phosphatase type 5
MRAQSATAIVVLFIAGSCAPDSGRSRAEMVGGSGGTSPSTGGSTSAGGAGGTGGNDFGGVGGTPGGGQAGLGGDAGAGGIDAGGSAGTAPDGEIRFAALGDTGKGTPEQLQVGQALAAKCAQDGCDFVQLLGDNIYESGVASVDDTQWQQKFEQPYAAVNAPFWVVLGNHDYGGAGVGFETARAQAEVDYTARSSKWKLPAKYYRRSASHVEFFAVDTTPAMFGQHAQQKAEVAAWIAESSATWKITFGHHPYLSNGPHGNAGSYDGVLGVITNTAGAGVKELLDGTACGATDVYISGHDHSLQWLSATCGGTALIVSGNGASATTLPGTNPAHYQSVELGFLYVVIRGNTFESSFIDLNGNVAFARTLTK